MIEKVIEKVIEKMSQSKKRASFYRALFNKNDLVFDIGANHGNRTITFLALGAKVVSIEPNPKLANLLRKKFGKRIQVIEKAIGSTNGTVDLFINESDVLSTTSKKWIEKIQETDRFGDVVNQFNQKVKVESTTLDSIFNAFGIPVFIKIDTEGLELEIIKTLKNANSYSLSFEFAIPESIQDSIFALEYLHSIGYNYFNLSLGESMEFITNKKMTFEQIINLITNLPEMAWGDIYAFNK